MFAAAIFLLRPDAGGTAFLVGVIDFRPAAAARYATAFEASETAAFGVSERFLFVCLGQNGMSPSATTGCLSRSSNCSAAYSRAVAANCRRCFVIHALVRIDAMMPGSASDRLIATPA